MDVRFDVKIGVKMPGIIAVLIATPILAIGLIHFYWAAGGEAGKKMAVPEIRAAGPGGQHGQWKKAFTPSKPATALVGIALSLLAAIVIMRAGLLPPIVAPWVLQWAVSLASAVMALRAIGDFRLVGFFKRVRGSDFARMDTWLYSPLCVLLALGLAYVAAS